MLLQAKHVSEIGVHGIELAGCNAYRSRCRMIGGFNESGQSVNHRRQKSNFNQLDAHN
jgi:hypothetical protein